MRKLLLLLLGLLVVACGTQVAETPTLDNLTIELGVDPDPPTAGETMLLITVTDADGSLVDDALVAVHGDMDHEGMIPVDGETSDSENGVYEIPFVWTMGGGWILDVTVTLPNDQGTATEQFELNVGAISQDSIINQSGSDTGAMDHEAMAGLETVIHYMPETNPALAGDASVTVMLQTDEGTPINDAVISLIGNMPDHEMMPINAETDTGMDGLYTLPIRWTMAGRWDVTIRATLADGTQIEETFEQEVVMPDGEEMEGMDMNSDDMDMNSEDDE